VSARLLLAGLAAMVVALGAASTAQASDYSDSCTSPTATVADGYAGQSTFVLAQAQPNPSNPSQEWVCYRVSSPSAGDVGGRFDVSTGSVSGGGAPTVDSDSSACQSTSGNQVPGTHPLVSGTILSEPFDFDAYSAPGTAWVCAQLASVQERIVIPVPSATVPTVVDNTDSPAPALPAPAADSYPSGTCQNATTGSPPSQLANMNTGGVQAWLYDWQPDPSTIDLCARVQGGSVAAGGVLSVSTDGSPGVTPILGPGSASACSLSIFTLTEPVAASLSTSPAGANPATVCVSEGSTSVAEQVGATGSPTAPTVTWTPDPGTP